MRFIHLHRLTKNNLGQKECRHYQFQRCELRKESGPSQIECKPQFCYLTCRNAPDPLKSTWDLVQIRIRIENRFETFIPKQSKWIVQLCLKRISNDNCLCFWLLRFTVSKFGFHRRPHTGSFSLEGADQPTII